MENAKNESKGLTIRKAFNAIEKPEIEQQAESNDQDVKIEMLVALILSKVNNSNLLFGAIAIMLLVIITLLLILIIM